MSEFQCNSCNAELVRDSKLCGSCGAGQEGVEQLAKRLKADSACGELIQMMTSASDAKGAERMETRDKELESRAKELLNEHTETTDKKFSKAVSESEARQTKVIADLREEMMAKLSIVGPARQSPSVGSGWQAGYKAQKLWMSPREPLQSSLMDWR